MTKLQKKLSKVKTYTPHNVTNQDGKIWFTYVNKNRIPVSAYYDTSSGSFVSVVKGSQYNGVALRKGIAKRVISKLLA
jgi:hypothetical protein|tara:strand:+ start:53 stop:286 length:234 start_codon:yes stop_codon:yes gene_type:complete